MIKCTGINCPMQFNKVDPRSCYAAKTCEYATPPITRADRIRAMTDEELATFLGDLSDCYECPAERSCLDAKSDCHGGMLAYLKGGST